MCRDMVAMERETCPHAPPQGNVEKTVTDIHPRQHIAAYGRYSHQESCQVGEGGNVHGDARFVMSDEDGKSLDCNEELGDALETTLGVEVRSKLAHHVIFVFFLPKLHKMIHTAGIT